MHLNPAISPHPRISTRSVSRRPVDCGPVGSSQASDEIHAYIAARDMALLEAERQTSDMTLNRAFLANQLVEDCLKPARAPYQAQSLPEGEATRERQRCGAARERLAQLRAEAKTRSFECAVAA